MTQAVEFSMRDLLEAGVHYGHKKNYWNPKMAGYIYGTRNGIHIIDLQQTYPLLSNALNFLKDIAAKGGKILFVATKKQASDLLADYALRCGQYYVNHRWLGGMLTNWSTISASLRTLQAYEDTLNNPDNMLTKKERLDLDRKREKLSRVLGGIRSLGGKSYLFASLGCCFIFVFRVNRFNNVIGVYWNKIREVISKKSGILV